MIRLLRRRWWLILLPVALGTMLGTLRLALSVDEKPAGDVADTEKASLAWRLDDARRRLVAHEKTLDEYAQRRRGQPASELPSSLRARDRAQTQLQSVRESITRAENERDALERQSRDTRQATGRQTKLAMIDRQIRAAQAEDARLRQAIAGYQTKVDSAITGDAVLRKLTQEYSTLRETYSSLLAEREGSRQDIVRESSPAAEPNDAAGRTSAVGKPRNQNERLSVMIPWIVGGLALGLALAALVESRDSSFKTEEDVKRILALPVLAAVPVMTSEQRERSGRRTWTSYSRTWILVALAGSAAALILWSLQP